MHEIEDVIETALFRSVGIVMAAVLPPGTVLFSLLSHSVSGQDGNLHTRVEGLAQRGRALRGGPVEIVVANGERRY